MRRVVITGLGIVSALGCDSDTFWRRLLAGDSGVATITSFDVAGLPAQIGAEVGEFDTDGLLTRKQRQRMSRVTQFAVVAAHHAVDAAGLDVAERPAAGVFIGCSQGGFVASEPYFEERYYSPLALLKPMNSAPASNISILLGMTGPTLTFDTACSSGGHAIGMAAQMIRDGRLDVALAGGTDTPFSPAIYRCWVSLHALSCRNETPQQACRPFSADRDGTVLGEGAAVLILEEAEHARARGADILAELVGYGWSSDAFHITQPNTAGMAAALRHALEDAAVAPEAVGYINAHGTGTPANDVQETEAIKCVFGPAAPAIPVSSIKPAVGHALAASGAIELTACVLALRDGMLPPTINYHERDPACDLDYIGTGARSAEIDVCVSNSFGFGGSNVSLVLRRFAA